MALVVDFNSVIGGDPWRTNSPASLPAWTIGDSTRHHMMGKVLLRVDEARAKGADMTQWGTAMACDWQSRQCSMRAFRPQCADIVLRRH